MSSLINALRPIVDRVRQGDIWIARAKKPPKHKRNLPLTEGRLARHLSEGPAIGACPLARGGSTVRVALHDIDDHGGEAGWGTVTEAAEAICDAAEDHGLRPHCFRSRGGNGIHIYYLWREPQDAYSTREALRAVLRSAGLAEGSRGIGQGEVELFPKQSYVPPDGWGSMFVLPLAGESVPLEPLADMAPWERAEAAGYTWELSEPVPIPETPDSSPGETPPGGTGGAEMGAESTASGITLDVLADALAYLPNPKRGEPGEVPYNDTETRLGWISIIFAIHHTDSGPDGLQLAHEWSANSDKYNPDELDNRIWPYVRSNRSRSITARSVLAEARKHGWSMPSWGIARDFTFEPAEPEQQAGPAEEAGEPAETGEAEEPAETGEAEEPAETGEAEEPAETGKAEGQAHASAITEEMPAGLARTESGYIKASINNLLTVLKKPGCCGFRIGYDQFKAMQTVGNPSGERMRPFRDTDYTRARSRLEALDFSSISQEMMSQAARLTAEYHSYDSAQRWLHESIPQWDGVERVARFLPDYFDAEDREYTQAVGLYLWTAMVGRIESPGCQADMMPIAQGPQGAGKSGALKAMVPSLDVHAEVNLTKDDNDIARLLRGKLIGEMDELRGMRQRDVEHLKAFVSRRHEEWIEKYREYATSYPRRCILFGTTNAEEFLGDETGQRRYLPFRCGYGIDWQAIERDRPQLWAEAYELWQAHGVMAAKAEELATDEHEQYRVADPWEELVSQWLDAPDMAGEVDADNAGRNGDHPLTITGVAAGALGISAAAVNNQAAARIRGIVQSLGYVNKKVQVSDGTRRMRWVRKDQARSPGRPAQT